MSITRAIIVGVGRLLACAALAGALPAVAATPAAMVFRHLTVDEGLAQNTVTASLQDSLGFMWFATEDGLDRYDGYTIRHFGHRRDSVRGLPGNFIWALREDRDGNVWAAVKDGGVVRINERTEAMTVFRHRPGDAHSLSSDAARQLLIGRDGSVWVATADGGVDRLDPRSGSVDRFIHDPAQEHSLASNAVSALAEDTTGRLWVGTDAGLDLFEPDARQFRHFRHAPQQAHSLPSDKVSALYVDRGGVLWIGTFDAGLARLQGDGRGFDVVGAAGARALSSPDVRDILQDIDGRLWVATAGGLDLLEADGSGFVPFRHDPADLSSLRDDHVMSLYQDRTGLLWVGTLAGGVSRWNPRSWRFGHARPAWLSGAYPIAFADDGTGGVWIGTQGAGLFRYDPATGRALAADEVLHQRHVIGDPRVMALLAARDGSLWVGTMGDGLERILRDGRRERYGREQFSAGGTRPLYADGVMALCEAADGRIWVGTFADGIAVIDPRTGAVQLVRPEGGHGGGPSAPVTTIAQGADGTIWAGTDGIGLLAFGADGALLGNWRHQDALASTLAADTVFDVFVDRAGRVWAGTDTGGLDEVIGSAAHPRSVRFRNYSTANGLGSNTVYGIESDALGGLWLSGTRGLARLNPASGQVRAFHREQGLQGEEFNFAAHARLRDGRLAFGGVNGFNIFDPMQVQNGPSLAPTIALTSIDIKGQPAPTPVPYADLARYTLGYRDDVATFEFAALDYATPEKNLYSYRLVGFDEHWSEPGVNRRATYTNLDAGDYIFEVRGASAEGQWTTVARRLPITVRPAPWRSRPAYTAYALLAGLLIWGYVANQGRRLRRASEQAARFEVEVAARTEELRATNSELERLTRAKSDFLARMSHEIRTPMNGIIGMGELLTRTKLDAAQSRIVNTVNKSARSLMQILNDTLDVAKIEAGRLTLRPEPCDLATLMTETAELFGAAAHDKGLVLVVAPAPQLLQHVLVDPLRLRQVLLNLIGNALKFTADGEIIVRADIIESHAERVRLHLIVRDTGIGMSADVVARIFDPFAQADESTTRRFGGTGLGLTICRELVSMMGGRLWACSTPGAGSDFTIELTLPLGAPLPSETTGTLRDFAVHTLRPSLYEALDRQAHLLGVRCRPLAAEAIAAGALGPEEALLIDVDSGGVASVSALLRAMSSAALRRCALLGAAQVLTAFDGAATPAAIRRLPAPVGPRALIDALSRAQRSSPSSPAPVPGVGDPRLSGRVLIVEDNAVNAAVLQGLLEAIGCRYVTAGNGREGIDAAAAGRFDAILMDVHMPDIDGWTATRAIRAAETGARTPIIALTADADEAHRRRCLEAGMDEFLTKPITLERLHGTLARWLRTSGGAVDGPTAAFSDSGEALSEQVWAQIEQLERSGRAGFAQRIATTFVETSARQVDEILAAATSGKSETVKQQCHALKSAAAHVGANRLAQLAIELEHAAADAQPSRIEELAPGLREAHAEAVVALEARIARRVA